MGLMDGKVCLITGATSGIGYYTAQEIARLGADVVIIGRDPARCQASVSQIQHATGSPSVAYIIADLSSQSQVRAAAGRFYQSHDHLDVLVNNAGSVFLFRKKSVDGIEMTFAVNHLAYFLLTLLLLPALKNSPSARVVSVSSGGHYNQHLDFDNLQLKGFYDPWHAYGRSKLANIYFAYELARRLHGTRVTSNALNPGLVDTEIWTKVNRLITPLLKYYVHRNGQSPLAGAQTSIYLATSPEVEGITGKYYASLTQRESSPVSHDQVSATRLWEISLEMTGLTRNQVF